MMTALIQETLTLEEMERFTTLAYQHTGIRIPLQKIELMSNRLSRRLRELHLPLFRDYYHWLEQHLAEEMPHFVAAITTHETYFFRCPRHFHFLAHEVLPFWKASTFDAWSAACSSGEEAYSLAILLRERLANFAQKRVRVFASDIDFKVLEQAHQGIYQDYALRLVKPEYHQAYFRPHAHGYQVVPELRQMIKLGQHNLKQPFPHGPVDLIFCRNVLIYFDQNSKEQVMHQLLAALKPKGYLFLGESEILPDFPGLKRLEMAIGQKL